MVFVVVVFLGGGVAFVLGFLGCFFWGVRALVFILFD